MNHKILAYSLAFGMAIACSAQAAPETVDFTITNSTDTVDGVITLAADSGTTYATSLYITYASDAGAIGFTESSTFDWVASATVLVNTFTLDGSGQVTADYFTAAAGGGLGDVVSLNNPNTSDSNIRGWSPTYMQGVISFTPVVTPEPTTLALTGIGALALVFRKRK